jgi:hypothetical protein
MWHGALPYCQICDLPLAKAEREVDRLRQRVAFLELALDNWADDQSAHDCEACIKLMNELQAADSTERSEAGDEGSPAVASGREQGE